MLVISIVKVYDSLWPDMSLVFSARADRQDLFSYQMLYRWILSTFFSQKLSDDMYRFCKINPICIFVSVLFRNLYFLYNPLTEIIHDHTCIDFLLYEFSFLGMQCIESNGYLSSRKEVSSPHLILQISRISSIEKSSLLKLVIIVSYLSSDILNLTTLQLNSYQGFSLSIKSNLIDLVIILYISGQAFVIFVCFKVSILNTSTSNSPSGNGPSDLVMLVVDSMS